MSESSALPAPRDLPAGATPEGDAPGLENAKALGLTASEYDLVVEKLGREPVQVELAMFSLMWSEHCSYKHSKKLLGTLPTEGPAIVLGPGENAGAVDVGDGWTVAFKVESHNHPSAVEPFQGAATGVGGILRDIFALGARPIAVLDALRFGEVDGDVPHPSLAAATDATSDGAVPGAASAIEPTSGVGGAGDTATTPAPSIGDDDGESGRRRSRFLLDGAVRGIGHYGNSIGVPNIGGDLYFEGPYETNCLVNAMALGLVREERLIRSAATGVGNVVVLFGAATGADGIGGASVLASAELGEDDASKRPTVQVGDPFEESKLVECSLELLERDLLVSLQDLGAAGLTSAASEMASKGEVGLDLDVALVPRRMEGLEPFEVMVSESQERMLCVVTPDKVDEVIAVTDKWDVHGTAIAVVTDTGSFRIFDGDAFVGDMPIPALVDDCPLYDIFPEKPTASIYPAPPRRIADGLDAGAALLALLGSSNIADRRPLFEQYDSIVQSRTVRRPGQTDAAVLMVPGPASRFSVGGGADAGAGHPSVAPEAGASGDGTSAASGPISGVGVSIDGSGRRVAADPYVGTIWNVLECAANLACVGAEPLGLTNNLNFGNPEKPHIAWQLTEAVRGLGDACRAVGSPVVGGNVSLYNEGTTGPIYPTPVVGMVGKVPDVAVTSPVGFASEGDLVALAGSFAPQLALSELAKLEGGAIPDGLPDWDLERTAAAIAAVRDTVREGRLNSCHDVAEGGLVTALAESALAGGVGATVELSAFAPDDADGRASLFGEAPGGFVVTGSAEALAVLAERTAVTVIGTVGGSALCVRCADQAVNVSLAALSEAHGALARLFA
ncbi:phosphoribosylformylglycinamidine synthase subunit PurL [Patulibacter minatonensis]|uniref:phosphoribosylformylglycinamidine synthase subunit PurL n=1 Tax=Patulibacter minatonensis TaxID=298163 RepID=UPI0004B8404E|nr:phosphoribosylformylglycinamidine synthase subunit PurL [Patulibacter minatonensis]